MDSLDTIQGFDISFSDYSKRIINIKIEDEIIDKLIFPFKKFDITALEYKPFTRFTLAKSLDDSTGERLGKFINFILLYKFMLLGTFLCCPVKLSIPSVGPLNGLNTIYACWVQSPGASSRLAPPELPVS